MTEKKTSKPTSEEQQEANRQNAKKSTGPRTEEGKGRSCFNATKYGVFLTEVDAIPRGPMAEDPDEVAADSGRIVSSLAPRDHLEEAQATVIARLFLQLGRLDRWQAEAVADAAHPTAVARGQYGPYALAGVRFAIERADTTLRVVANGEVVVEDVRTAADVLRHFRGEAVPIVDVWDDDHEPSTDEEWARVVMLYVRHYWGDDIDAALEALNASHRKLSDELADREGRESEIAAREILAKAFDLATRYQGRLGRELERALDQYWKLQERDLDPDD